MKRIIALAVLLAAVFSVSAQSFKDGVYFAQEDAFQRDGWKYQVVLEVKGGKIVDAAWNAVNKLGQPDKVALSTGGKYGMIKVSKIKKEWHEQAAAVEDYWSRPRTSTSASTRMPPATPTPSPGPRSW
jgi:hypothetical protein